MGGETTTDNAFTIVVDAIPIAEEEINVNVNGSAHPASTTTPYAVAHGSSITEHATHPSFTHGSTNANPTTTTTTTYTIPPPSASITPVQISQLGRSPVPFTCPYCKATTRTIPVDEITCFTVAMFVLLLLIFWPICWLPFALPACKDTRHSCANCGRLIGVTQSCES